MRGKFTMVTTPTLSLIDIAPVIFGNVEEQIDFTAKGPSRFI